jgi:hypothetical protein
MIEFQCAHCGKRARRAAGHVNRQRALGMNVYCGRRCSGLGRRKPKKSKAQRVAEKRAYDQEYRRRNRAMLKAKKRAYHVRTYDPEKARIERKKKMARHVEYCRRPEYKAWKRWYDAEYRAKEYGEFAEAYKAVLELNRTIKRKVSNYEIRLQNQTLCKSQKRRRQAGITERGRNIRRRDSAAHG